MKIVGSTIVDNAAPMSGGLHCWYTDLETTATTFDHNVSDFGGGIHADFSALTLSESTFSNNRAANGGAFHIWNSDLAVDQCLFVSNSVTAEGGAIEYNLADTLVFQRPYEMVITGTDFLDNQADFRSAGVRISQYNMDASMADVILEGCDFIDNRAERNAALNMSGNIEDFLIINCTFNKNRATLFGGGSSFSNGCSGNVVNCLFTENMAVSGNPGAAGISNGAFVHFVNCTFAENEGGSIGAVFVHRDGKASLTNCIVWDNVPSSIAVRGIRDGALSELYVNYCDIQFGSDSIQTDDLAILHWGEGNIRDDPSFMDPLGGDYSLNEGSPCIDFGIDQITIAGISIEAPATDLLGNPRDSENYAPPDIGAYEDQTITFLDHNFVSGGLEEYPNPFDDQLYIEIDQEGDQVPIAQLFDALGRVVTRFTLRMCDKERWCAFLETKDLPGGLYFCRVSCGQFSETRKLILQR